MRKNVFSVVKAAALLLAFVVMMGVCPRAEAQRAAAESDLEVGLTSDGAGVVIKKYVGKGGAVIIPATIQGMPVRVIEERAFSETFKSNPTITSVTIPNSVTEIGQSAFGNCKSLTSITIPNSVTEVGRSAFTSCVSLVSVSLPNSLTSISELMFSECTSLKTITIPNSVTRIDRQAFVMCSGLTSVTIADNIIEIGPQVFSSCSSLVTVTISSVEGRKWDSDSFGAFDGCRKLDLKSQAALKAAGYTGSF